MDQFKLVLQKGVTGLKNETFLTAFVGEIDNQALLITGNGNYTWKVTESRYFPCYIRKKGFPS